MDGFKTFPLLSPVICFSVPALWKDALNKFGLATTSVKIPTILLVVSGFLFTASLFLFWIGKARRKKATGPTFLGLPPLFTAVLEFARDIAMV